MSRIRGVDDARVVSVGRIVGFHVRCVDVGSIGPTRINLDVVGPARRYLALEYWVQRIRDVIEAYARERAVAEGLARDRQKVPVDVNIRRIRRCNPVVRTDVVRAQNLYDDRVGAIAEVDDGDPKIDV